MRMILAWHNVNWVTIRLYSYDLYDAENFSVLFYLPGHHHPLTENRSGQWACNLEQPSRLIYKPIIPDELVQSEEQIDLVQLVELSVIEITDYHDKKIKR